ncbi:MAG: enoyl-CoA hydratase/isomerase family protein [bacterium]
MMDVEDLEYLESEAHGSVVLLRMDHESENRFSLPFINELEMALSRAEEDAAVRALVFTGAHEKYFSNGLDLPWLIKQERSTWLDFTLSWEALLHRLFLFGKPVVAAINGHAFAGGLFFALAADWRVMRKDRGWCCIPEIDLPLDLPPGNVALIAHVIGSRNADYYSLSADRLPPEEALRIGMMDELADAVEVVPCAIRKAEELSKKNQDQYARHKRNLRAAPARALKEEDPPYIREMIETGKHG